MKNKRFGFFAILAFAALASSCGTSGYYSSSAYSDGIYYRPTQESRAKIIAEKEARASRQYDQYLARDEEGNLYVVTELMDGETYESRLHKFDSPWYVNPYWYDTWNYGWYNSWYGYRPFYAYYPTGLYSPYWYGWYDPWVWGGIGYAGWYAWNRWYDYPYYHHPYYHGGGGYIPGPGPSSHRSVAYTPRNATRGAGMYRTTDTPGSRGMYTTHRTSSGGSISTRTSSSGTTTVRSTSTSSRPARTGASSSSGSYTRSSGSYSSGSSSRSSGSYSGGGGYSGGGSSGRSVSGGSHSGGGRR